MATKVVFTIGDNIFVIRKGKTSNKKITDGSQIVQTYTFSKDQYDWVQAGNKGMKEFFKLDGTNCLDCPFSGNHGDDGCYTHKGVQYFGMISMLKSIDAAELKEFKYDADWYFKEPHEMDYNSVKSKNIVEMCEGRYVRFGTYGEPSLLPLEMVEDMADFASSYTGYTHQWMKPEYQGYSNWFMASVHGKFGAKAASKKGWRSFIATTDSSVSAVQCPASKEAGFKSNCATCGLCSGTKGKGKKDIKILVH